jgi:hypothetical protein
MPSKSASVAAAITKTEAIVVVPIVADAPVSVTETSGTLVQTREERYKSFLASIDSQLAVLKTLRGQAVANFKADNNDFKSAQKSSRRRRAPAVAADENAVKVA